MQSKGELREVQQPAPVIEEIEARGERGRVVGGILRVLRYLFRRRHEAKVQAEVNRRWHDKLRVGAPEREDMP